MPGRGEQGLSSVLGSQQRQAAATAQLESGGAGQGPALHVGTKWGLPQLPLGRRLGTLGSSEELVPVEGEPGALCEEPGQWRGLLPAQTKAWLCSVFVQLLYKSQQEIACSEGLQPRQGGSLAPSRHKPRRASSPLPHGPSTLQFAAWGGFEQLKMEAARGTRAKCPLETCLPRLQLQLAITPTELFRSAGRNTPVPAYPVPQPSLCTPACPRGAAPCNLPHVLSSARPGARPSPSALPRRESGLSCRHTRSTGRALPLPVSGSDERF